MRNWLKTRNELSLWSGKALGFARVGIVCLHLMTAREDLKLTEDAVPVEYATSGR